MFLFRSHENQKNTINPSFSFHYFGIVNFEFKTNNRRLQSLQGRRKKPARGTGRSKKNAKVKGRGRGGRVPLPLSQSPSLSASYFFRAYHGGSHLQDSV